MGHYASEMDPEYGIVPPGHEWVDGFEAVHLDTINESKFQCLECAAIVMQTKRTHHKEWHKGLSNNFKFLMI